MYEVADTTVGFRRSVGERRAEAANECDHYCIARGTREGELFGDIDICSHPLLATEGLPMANWRSV